MPKEVAENEERGTIVTGDSGDDEGEGAVNEEESAVEMVVVGEESVDSEVCVDVESRCLCKRLVGWFTSSVSGGGRLLSSVRVPSLLSAVPIPRLSILLWSRPYTLLNDGN